MQAINALGRSDVFLKLEILKKAIGLTILGISIFHGVYAIAIGMVITGIIATFINAYPNLKLLDYSYIEQWKDIMPSMVISLIMGAVAYSFNYLSVSPGWILVLQLISATLVYIGLAKAFKIESYEYLKVTIKELIKNRKEEKR